MRRSGMQALSEVVQTRSLRLAGHVIRLPDVRPARVVMTWIPESGRRTSSRPPGGRRSFKEDLHRMNLTCLGARRAANDIDTGGEIASPNVSSVTGGTKSK